MSTGFIVAGFLFLLNPDLFTFDIFPDLIGYLLISVGLKKMAFLEDRIATSRRFFHYLAVISALKLLSSPAAIVTTVESTRLMICFVFFVCEIWLGYIAASNAMKGVQYLAIRKDGNLALKGYETAEFFLVGFMIVKPVASFLAPGTTIFFPNVDADPEVVETSRRTFMTARTVMFVIGAVILLSFGVYAFRVLLAYRSRCLSDRIFCENVRKDYDEKVALNESMQNRLSIKNAFFWFFLGFVFLGDLYLDDIWLIPTFLFPLSVFLGLSRLAPFVTLPRWGKIVSLAATAVSGVTYGYRTLRLIQSKNAADFAMSFVTDPAALVLGVVSGGLVLASAVFMLIAVSKCAAKYTSGSYRLYFIVLSVLIFSVVDIGFAQYLFPSTFSVLPSAQWVLWAIGMYLHKKSLDDVRDEADYKLM